MTSLFQKRHQNKCTKCWTSNTAGRGLKLLTASLVCRYGCDMCAVHMTLRTGDVVYTAMLYLTSQHLVCRQSYEVKGRLGLQLQHPRIPPCYRSHEPYVR